MQNTNTNTKAHSVHGLTEYTTYISDTYLQKLETPKEFFDTELQIQHRFIPIDPKSPMELYLAIQQACSVESEEKLVEHQPSKKRELAEISGNNENKPKVDEKESKKARE